MKLTKIEIRLPEFSADHEGIGPRNLAASQAGRWSGSSPFAPVLETLPDGLLALDVTDTVGAWVSAGGIIKASSSGWMYRAW